MELVLKDANWLRRFPLARLTAFAVSVPLELFNAPVPLIVTLPATVIVPVLDREPSTRVISPAAVNVK